MLIMSNNKLCIVLSFHQSFHIYCLIWSLQQPWMSVLLFIYRSGNRGLVRLWDLFNLTQFISSSIQKHLLDTYYVIMFCPIRILKTDTLKKLSTFMRLISYIEINRYPKYVQYKGYSKHKSGIEKTVILLSVGVMELYWGVGARVAF